MNNIKIVALSGSLRKDSYTIKPVKAFGMLAPQNAFPDLTETGTFLLVKQETLPERVTKFRKAIDGTDDMVASRDLYRLYSCFFNY